MARFGRGSRAHGSPASARREERSDDRAREDEPEHGWGWASSASAILSIESDACGDMVAMGVIDPAKVVRTALQNASSVAGLMLTTEALVAEKPKEEKAPAGGGHGGHGHGGDF